MRVGCHAPVMHLAATIASTARSEARLEFGVVSDLEPQRVTNPEPRSHVRSSAERPNDLYAVGRT
jgi:hypothetical protein